MGAHKGQFSVEVVVIAAVMMGVLFTILLANQHLQGAWAVQKQRLQAGAAADQLALAINQAAAWGNSTRITFNNRVGADVSSVSVYSGRSVRAYYREGGFYSVPLATNQTNISGPVPLNREITVVNSEGVISITVNG